MFDNSAFVKDLFFLILTFPKMSSCLFAIVYGRVTVLIPASNTFWSGDLIPKMGIFKGFNDIVGALENVGLNGIGVYGNGWTGVIIEIGKEGWKGKVRLSRRDGTVVIAGRNGTLGIIGNVGR